MSLVVSFFIVFFFMSVHCTVKNINTIIMSIDEVGSNFIKGIL